MKLPAKHRGAATHETSRQTNTGALALRDCVRADGWTARWTGLCLACVAVVSVSFSQAQAQARKTREGNGKKEQKK